MTTNYVSQDLFGGTLRVDIPEGFTDISDVRQVPDHQEVFASNTTETSIVVEITERVERKDWETASEIIGGARELLNPVVEDEKAVRFHVEVLCSEDGESHRMYNPPMYDPVPKIDAPAYTCQSVVGNLPTGQPDAQGETTWSAQQRQVSTIHVIVVRLVRQKADILVHVNVPHAELETSGGSVAVRNEETFARGVLDRLRQTLEILDYGLFY